MKRARQWSIVVALLLVGVSFTPVLAVSPSAVVVYGEIAAVWTLSPQELTTLKDLGFPGL